MTAALLDFIASALRRVADRMQLGDTPTTLRLEATNKDIDGLYGIVREHANDIQILRDRCANLEQHLHLDRANAAAEQTLDLDDLGRPARDDIDPDEQVNGAALREGE